MDPVDRFLFYLFMIITVTSPGIVIGFLIFA